LLWLTSWNALITWLASEQEEWFMNFGE
jgi:hypothetical protein